MLNNKKYNKEIKDIVELENQWFDKSAFYTKVKTSEEEQIIIPKMQYDKIDESLISGKFDYVRFRSFELAANEITNQNVSGEIAELGVFRGEFAALINQKFSNRKLYLFDTFEGFEENELKKDMEKGYLDQEFADCFKNTSVDLVLSKMQHPEQCIVHKGFFPQTAQGVEEKFAFVSIDVDLEEPIYSGLEYFYPRLEKGGFIFIHDYNSKLQGVKNALKRYESNYGFVIKMPICDLGGTIVILK